MPDEEICSFCGLPKSAVRKLLRGGGQLPPMHGRDGIRRPAVDLPFVFVCDECISFAAEICSSPPDVRRESDLKEEPVFLFLGTADGVPSEIVLSQPRPREDDWSAHLRMTGAFREDMDVYGATKEQAIELALGLCHLHVGTRSLLDLQGTPVRLPGKPLPESSDRDDGGRPTRGVSVCLVSENNGTTRVVFDDLVRDGDDWRRGVFYTHVRFPQSVLFDLGLSQDEFAKVGVTLLLRLVADAQRRNSSS
jgi:hypothetical protein